MSSASSLGLSVVIPHFNRPLCLELALDTLRPALSSLPFPSEVIVADDGSEPEVLRFVEKLPVDLVMSGVRRVAAGHESRTVYDRLWEAYRRARFRYLLHVEDDFWFVPGGFVDQGKCHLAGLLAVPGRRQPDAQPFSGAVELLEQNQTAHMVELARSFANARYPSLVETERVYGGVPFRAKALTAGTRWYACAWPHLMRTTEALAVPFPLGSELWIGERQLCERRCRHFGPAAWVYDPGRCYFVHANVFSWRATHGRRTDSAFLWADVADPARLPFAFEAVTDLADRLLCAFKRGLRNDLAEFRSTAPMAYVHRRLYEAVCP